MNTSISGDYCWSTSNNGSADMRKAINRDNISKIASRLDQLRADLFEENIRLNKENYAMKIRANLGEHTEACCPICMDVPQGSTVLKCGHSMCAGCFALHARVDNRCPFCRDEFAVNVKKNEPIQDEQLAHIANKWTRYHRKKGYFKKMATRFKKSDDMEAFAEWLVRENGKIMMENVRDWYDN